MICFKIAGLIVGVWGGFKLAELGIGWAKHYLKKLKPPEDY